jgi:hypothetical protein
MTHLQDSFPAISHALKSWLSAVNQRNFVTAKEELKRAHVLMQSLRIDHRYVRVWEKHFAVHDAEPLDFIAAVTEATRPGRYRVRSSSRSIQND